MEEGLTDEEINLDELEELLVMEDTGNGHTSDFITGASSSAGKKPKNLENTLIDEFEHGNTTIEEKKEIIERLGAIQKQKITHYLGNMMLNEEHKELRIKAAEILALRMDEAGLDYLMTGIKTETDSEVRKRIAWAYSRLKYKK